jgi:hypothetical protein
MSIGSAATTAAIDTPEAYFSEVLKLKLSLREALNTSAWQE